jgi:hypothetical protein
MVIKTHPEKKLQGVLVVGRGRGPAAPPRQGGGGKANFFEPARSDPQIRSYSGNPLTFSLKFIKNIC